MSLSPTALPVASPITLPAPTRVDTRQWPRREAFEFFRTFDKPYFNVCTRVNVAPLQAWLKAGAPGGLTLATYHLALRLAHEHPAFGLRLEGGEVWRWPRMLGSTTVLRPDDSFGFAYLPYTPDGAAFVAQARRAIAAAREPGAVFDAGRPAAPVQPAVPGVPVGPLDDRAALHFTTLPWVHFSSFSHARNWGREDAIPKFAFGRVQMEGAAAWMPVSVEVHHALVDGVHVGRFMQAFEAALLQPQAWWPGPGAGSAAGG